MATAFLAQARSCHRRNRTQALRLCTDVHRCALFVPHSLSCMSRYILRWYLAGATYLAMPHGQINRLNRALKLTGQHATVNQSLRDDKSSSLDASWLTYVNFLPSVDIAVRTALYKHSSMISANLPSRSVCVWC